MSYAKHNKLIRSITRSHRHRYRFVALLLTRLSGFTCALQRTATQCKIQIVAFCFAQSTVTRQRGAARRDGGVAKEGARGGGARYVTASASNLHTTHEQRQRQKQEQNQRLRSRSSLAQASLASILSVYVCLCPAPTCLPLSPPPLPCANICCRPFCLANLQLAARQTQTAPKGQ